MIPDALHPHFIFQMLVLSGVALILLQMKTADEADKIRHQTGRWFWLRRITQIAKAMSLCWAVSYSWQNNWIPWPPFTAFMVAFDVWLIAHIAIMRADINRMVGRRRYQAGATDGLAQ